MDAALRDHHRPVEIARRPPVRHQALAQRVGVLADHDPARVVVALNRLGRRTLAHEPQRLPLPLGHLPAVLLELDHRQPIHERAERPAGPDRRELAVVADEHELDVEPTDPLDQLGELAGGQHAGLVDDEHRAARQRRERMALERLEQGRDARARDAGALLELTRRAARHRGAVDPAAARRPRLVRRAERERLARPRRPEDECDAVAVEREPPHHLALLVDERRPTRERTLDRLRSRKRRSRAAARDGELEDRSLEREQLRRRVDPLRGDGGDHAAVAELQDVASLTGNERNGERRAQELVGEALNLGRSQRRARRKHLAQRLQNIAARERGALLGEPARAGEPRRDLLNQLRRQRRDPHATAEPADDLAGQPELRGALAPFRNEPFRCDPIVLGTPGLQRRDLGSRGAARSAPLELGLDVGAAPAERPQHGRRDAVDLGDPVAHRSPLDAELAREQRRAAALRRGSRRSWRARRCGARRASTIARRRRASGWRRGHGCAAAGRRPARCDAGTPPRRTRCRRSRARRPARAASPPPRAPCSRARRATAWSWASRSVARSSSSPMPKRTLTLFGAEKVRSKPGTRALRTRPSGSPVAGCSPLSTRSSSRAPTVPRRPSAAAPAPAQMPSASGPPR